MQVAILLMGNKKAGSNSKSERGALSIESLPFQR
jgi:hypothetical protein